MNPRFIPSLSTTVVHHALRESQYGLHGYALVIAEVHDVGRLRRCGDRCLRREPGMQVEVPVIVTHLQREEM